MDTVTVEECLEAFVENGLEPVHHSFGNSKETGCLLTALALSRVGRVQNAGDHAADTQQLELELGPKVYNQLMSGYDKKPECDRARLKHCQRVGFEVAQLLRASENDPAMALERYRAERAASLAVA